MRELHVLGLTPDGRHLLLATGPDASKATHRIAVDDRFERALKGERPHQSADAPTLSVKDIQARLRAGETVDEVARSAGLPRARIERFAGPVMSERADMLRRLQQAHQVGRRGRSALPLEAAVAAGVAALANVKHETAAWTAYRAPDGGWVAAFSVTARGRTRRGTWSYDEAAGASRPLDPWASSLGHVEVAVEEPRRRRVEKVTPSAPSRPRAAARTAAGPPTGPTTRRQRVTPAGAGASPADAQGAPVTTSTAVPGSAAVPGSKPARAAAAKTRATKAAAQAPAAAAASSNGTHTADAPGRAARRATRGAQRTPR